jgi:hypothetical protein
VKTILSQGGKTSESSTSFTLAGSPTAPESESAATGSTTLPEAPKGPLKITFPPNPSGQPTPEEIKSILADATKYAMAYKESLPNFMCEQVTDRSLSHVDPNGTSGWKHKDKFTELLTYFNHQENRILLEMEQDGSKSQDIPKSPRGVVSAGEFGVALSGLFRPVSKAEFQWKESGMLEDGTVQVFDYRVARENSTFHLRGSNVDVITVGYHGQVIIDSATRTVRRITQVVDDIPLKFPIQGVSTSIDYDYVVINNHDYMLPIGAQVTTKKSRHETDLNEIAYHGFRRFSSTSKIIFDPNAVK